MAPSLTTLLPPTRSGRTFFIASSLLGACAFVQLLMLGWYLLHGTRPQTAVVLPIIRFSETTQPGASVFDTTLQPVPFAVNPMVPAIPRTADASPIYPLMTRPTPALSTRASPEGNDLLEQARQMRQHGDMNAALGRLREAQVAEPENPQIVAEMAITYEAMQLPEKAAEQWQRLFGMGETIGALYYLADSKLHGPPTGAGAASGDPGSERSGFPSNAVLKITDIHLEEIQDPSAEKKLALKIVVKNRPGMVIDPNKVKIEAYFYDLVDGRDIVQTDAQTDYAWLTPAPINWANDKSEVLEAMYIRVKGMAGSVLAPEPPRAPLRHGSRGGKSKGAPTDDQTATPPPATPVRAFLGYTVRLYYDRQLQDVKADPVRLLQQFPPPLTLAVE